MSNDVTLKIDGVSQGEIVGLTNVPTWTIKSTVISRRNAIANSKNTRVEVKEYGTDIITVDIDIDNTVYPYRIQIAKRLQELKELYKGEHVTVTFEQTTGSGTETLTFDDCICISIDMKIITDGAGGTLTYKFECGNIDMKIDQLRNGCFLLPNGTTETRAKYWTLSTLGCTAKRVQISNGNFAILLSSDSGTAEAYAYTDTHSDASSDDIAIFYAEIEYVDQQDDFYSSTPEWNQTEDVDSEQKVELYITDMASNQAQDTFVLTKNTKSIIAKTAIELSASTLFYFYIRHTGGTGAVLIKRAWLETRKINEC